MKFIPFAITGLVNIGIGILLFFFLLLGLNGYSEKQAMPGLIIFIAWVILVSLLSGVLSIFATDFLVNKKAINFWISSLMSTLIFVVVGGAFNVVGWFVSLFITEALR
jgi:hypothetical protein